MEKEYLYKNNMHVIDVILDEFMLTRTCQEVEDFEEALPYVFLKLYPCVDPQEPIVKEMFEKYCEDYNIKEWYNSTFTVKIIKK